MAKASVLGKNVQISSQPANDDVRQTRSEATRMRLIHAAEKLFAEDGLEHVSIRAIILAAEQKNESVLQYHFGSKAGLIEAIHRYRGRQIDDQRALMLAELQQAKPVISLREVAALMIGPVVKLAAQDQGFRQYLQVFGPLMALSNENIKQRLGHKRRLHVEQLKTLLRVNRRDLDDEMLEIQLDHAARFASLAMSNQARLGKVFSGKKANFFYQNLLDNLVAILSVEVSTEARQAK